MDIKHLRTFLRIVRHNSISAAALEEGVSQPALSKILRRLELEIGVPLFDRLPRGLAPTEAGRALAEAARDIDTSLRSALRHIDAVRQAFTGELRIGAGATWRDKLLPLAVSRLLSARPQARVSIVTGVADELVAGLLAGDTDVILAPLREGADFARELATEELVTDQLVVVARSGHPLAERDDVPLCELVSARWAVPASPSGIRQFRELFSAERMTPPIPSLETEDMNCLLEIVSKTDLVAYVPRLRMLHRSGGGLSIVRSRSARMQRTTGILYRRRIRLTPLQTEFCSLLREIAMSHARDI